MNALNSEPPNYGPAAFNSGKIPLQPGHREREDFARSDLFRTTLRWGNYANLQPWQDVGAQLQSGMHNASNQDNNSDCHVNHQRWNFETSNIFLTLLPFLKWWSIVFFPWILWGFAITGAFSNFFDQISASKGVGVSMIFGLLIAATILISFGLSAWFMWRDQPRYKAYLCLVTIGFLTALTSSILNFKTAQNGTSILWLSVAMSAAVFMGLLGWDCLRSYYLRVFQHDGSEFNRQTGMVKVARRFRPAFTAPFYEFDATMEMRPGPHGNSSMTVWLHHRYSDFEIFLGGKIQSLGMSREECLAFWDTLQRYMDVSQPLPELPILEQFRHLDPTTDAQDKLSKRPLRRWRDTKYKVWDRTERPAMMQKNLQYPWQSQACILIARIDPTLSVEAYYRAQEAKGIHSTPKADDYDNIHRG